MEALERVPGVAELALQDRNLAVAIDWDKKGSATKWRLLQAGYDHLGAIMRRNAIKLQAVGAGDWVRPPSAAAVPARVGPEAIAAGVEQAAEILEPHRGVHGETEGDEDGVSEHSGDESLLESGESDRGSMPAVWPDEGDEQQEATAVQRLQAGPQSGGTGGLGRLARVLVTGSRNWEDRQLIESVLMSCHDAHGPFVLVHGAAAGADTIAAETHARWGGVVEAHPADWSLGRGAGVLRNQAMVDLGADTCIAFIRNESRGATDCLNRAIAAGIPWGRWRAQ